MKSANAVFWPPRWRASVQRAAEPRGGPAFDVIICVNEIRNPGCRPRHRNDRCVCRTVWAVDSCAALHWNCVVVLGPPRTVDSPEVEVSDSTCGPVGRFRERHYLLRVVYLPTVCSSYAECTEDHGCLRGYRCGFISRGSRGSNFRRGSFAHSTYGLRLSRDDDVGVFCMVLIV